MEYKAKLGDIFLCDSDRIAAKIVKFFMTAPTIYQYIWRAIRGTQETVRYYHAGLVLSNTQIIEQQSKVQYGDTQKILSRKIIIYRKKDLTEEQQNTIKNRALEDLGRGYGIILVLTKTFAWLTGMYFLVNWIGALFRKQEICINRVCKWYNHICDFGSPKYFMDTTKTVDEYCQNHPEEWKVVYKND